MAGKKKGGKSGAGGGGGSNKATPREESSSATPAALEAESSNAPAAEASEAPSAEPSTVESGSPSKAEPEPAEPPSASGGASAGEVEALRRELAECRTIITELQQRNASLTEEVQRLKASPAASATALAPVVDANQLESLQSRIATLKAEQAEADAAREAAWRQLKTVVSDIARLAAPDASIKVGTPTAAGGAAGFGAA